MAGFVERTDNGEYLDQLWESKSEDELEEDELEDAKQKRIPRLMNRGQKKTLDDIMVSFLSSLEN